MVSARGYRGGGSAAEARPPRRLPSATSRGGDVDALYVRGFAAGVQAAKDAVQHVIDTSAYGYVAWEDVLSAIDKRAQFARNSNDGEQP